MTFTNVTPEQLQAHYDRLVAGATPSRGCGDCLHDLILATLKLGPNRECGCEDKILQMNLWGPRGCRENLEIIVEWLVEQAKEFEWEQTPPWRARAARWLAKRGETGEAFVRSQCRRMAMKAIKKCENCY